MKKTLTAAAMVLAMTALANAATPIVTPSGKYLWQGELSITTATPAAACSSGGNDVGQFAHAVFAPKGAPNDQNQDKLMLFPLDELSAMQSAMLWVSNTSSTKGLLNGATSVTSTGIDTRGSHTGTQNGAFSFPTPPTPTAVGSSTVTVSFKIKTPDGCTFTAYGNLRGPF